MSAYTFIDSVTGLSNVLNAAFFAVDQINCAFCLAVIASIDRECFFCVMTGEFRSFLHEFTYDTWANCRARCLSGFVLGLCLFLPEFV